MKFSRFRRQPKVGWARDSHVCAAPSRGRCGAAGAATRAGRLTKGRVRERCARVSDGGGRAACCAVALRQPESHVRALSAPWAWRLCDLHRRGILPWNVLGGRRALR